MKIFPGKNHETWEVSAIEFLSAIVFGDQIQERWGNIV